MVDVRGDVLRPPHGTTPAAVKSNKNQKFLVYFHCNKQYKNEKRHPRHLVLVLPFFTSFKDNHIYIRSISLDLGIPDFHCHIHRHYGNPRLVSCRVILNAHLRLN